MPLKEDSKLIQSQTFLKPTNIQENIDIKIPTNLQSWKIWD